VQSVVAQDEPRSGGEVCVGGNVPVFTDQFGERSDAGALVQSDRGCDVIVVRGMRANKAGTKGLDEAVNVCWMVGRDAGVSLIWGRIICSTQGI